MMGSRPGLPTTTYVGDHRDTSFQSGYAAPRPDQSYSDPYMQQSDP